jgi:hypothetical protein
MNFPARRPRLDPWEAARVSRPPSRRVGAAPSAAPGNGEREADRSRCRARRGRRGALGLRQLVGSCQCVIGRAHSNSCPVHTTSTCASPGVGTAVRDAYGHRVGDRAWILGFLATGAEPALSRHGGLLTTTAAGDLRHRNPDLGDSLVETHRTLAVRRGLPADDPSDSGRAPRRPFPCTRGGVETPTTRCGRPPTPPPRKNTGQIGALWVVGIGPVTGMLPRSAPFRCNP